MPPRSRGKLVLAQLSEQQQAGQSFSPLAALGDGTELLDKVLLPSRAYTCVAINAVPVCSILFFG
jgi:hypothetical protein